MHDSQRCATLSRDGGGAADRRTGGRSAHPGVTLLRVAIVGAGPAGLYLAYLLERRQPGIDVRMSQQNPADATFGFGVVFSDRALQFLREDDAETYEAIVPAMESWSDMTLGLNRLRSVSPRFVAAYEARSPCWR